MLTVAKGLPLTYNKDLQEDKEALFDAVDTTLAVLDVLPPMLRTPRCDRERLAAAAIADFSLATDAADLLARRGVPFREAHEIVGRLVAPLLPSGQDLRRSHRERVGRGPSALRRGTAAADRRGERRGPRRSGGTAPGSRSQRRWKRLGQP